VTFGVVHEARLKARSPVPGATDGVRRLIAFTDFRQRRGDVGRQMALRSADS